MKNDTQDLLKFAKQQAFAAGNVMRKYFNAADMQVSFKSDKSIVTCADTKINQCLIEAVKRAYPLHGIVGEEQSYQEDSEELWVCDPIDGTDAFVNGVPTAMFSLAYVVSGVPMVAVAYEPVQRLLFYAIKGQGAYMNGEHIAVSNHGSLDGASVMLVSSLKEFLVCQDMYKKLIDNGVQLRITPGNVFKACLLARGKIDGYYFPGLTPHDIAATKLIVEEAGGTVTDLNGHEQRYDREICGAILSNGNIHADLVAAVQSFGVDIYKGF